MIKEPFGKIVRIILSILTVLLAVLFIIQVNRFNAVFTQKKISLAFLQILPVIIAWVLCVIASLFAEYKPAVNQMYRNRKINTSKTHVLIMNIIYCAIILLCIGFTIGYLCQSNHFTSEAKTDILNALTYLSPFAVVALICSVVRQFYVQESMIPLLNVKQNYTVTVIFRVVLFGVGFGFLIAGLVSHQELAVLEKAKRICLECIGIG